MAKYDHGGGCPCGLYAECDTECAMHPRYKPPKTDEEIEIERLRAEVARLQAALWGRNAS